MSEKSDCIVMILCTYCILYLLCEFVLIVFSSNDGSYESAHMRSPVRVIHCLIHKLFL